MFFVPLNQTNDPASEIGPRIVEKENDRPNNWSNHVAVVCRQYKNFYKCTHSLHTFAIDFKMRAQALRVGRLPASQVRVPSIQAVRMLTSRAAGKYDGATPSTSSLLVPTSRDLSRCTRHAGQVGHCLSNTSIPQAPAKAARSAPHPPVPRPHTRRKDSLFTPRVARGVTPDRHQQWRRYPWQGQPQAQA